MNQDELEFKTEQAIEAFKHELAAFESGALVSQEEFPGSRALKSAMEVMKLNPDQAERERILQDLENQYQALGREYSQAQTDEQRITFKRKVEKGFREFLKALE